MAPDLVHEVRAHDSEVEGFAYLSQIISAHEISYFNSGDYFCHSTSQSSPQLSTQPPDSLPCSVGGYVAAEECVFHSGLQFFMGCNTFSIGIRGIIRLKTA